MPHTPRRFLALVLLLTAAFLTTACRGGGAPAQAGGAPTAAPAPSNTVVSRDS